MNRKIGIPTFIVALIALGFQIHSWAMQYIIYKEKFDDGRRSEQMNRDYIKIQNESLLNPGIKPDFVAKNTNKFDLEINTSISEESEDDLSAKIWRYYPGKYVLSKTQEGQAILRTIEWQLDEILEKNRNKGKNVEIAIEAIGSADALPFRKKVYYDGLLGDTLRNIRYYRIDKPNTPLQKTFIKDETLITNELLALLRALDAVRYLNAKYYIKDEYIKILTREFDEIGPEYRKLDLKITMKDVFLEDYNDLSFGSKMVGKFLK
jgi:hypothetical protein